MLLIVCLYCSYLMKFLPIIFSVNFLFFLEYPFCVSDLTSSLVFFVLVVPRGSYYFIMVCSTVVMPNLPQRETESARKREERAKAAVTVAQKAVTNMKS